MSKLTACALVLALAASPSSADQSFTPTDIPWIVLTRDAGLGGRGVDGLVFAVWRDGTILRRPVGSTRSDLFELAVLEPRQMQRLGAHVAGLRRRSNATRYLDLPEVGLVIREGSATRCWIDTPGIDVTPGVEALTQSTATLALKGSAEVTVALDQWLPWSQYREPACAS